jgi:aspartyl-tRNA(Asn)/glutamyl-tRNA(Gln) amidotransferase subunit B
MLRLRSALAGPSRLAYPRFARSVSTVADDGWELIVGLEIHAQIRTGRKLFSRELTFGELGELS